MKNFLKMAIIAATVSGASASANAQTVNASTGTTSSTTSINHVTSASQMVGMKVTGVLETGSITGFDLWRNLGGDVWGADIFNGTTHIARVYMTPGTSDTYSSNWNVQLYSNGTNNNLKSLTFEGGLGFGGVLFDRSCSNSNATGLDCTSFGSFGTGTATSDVGRDASFNDLNWRGITTSYTNAVGLGASAPVGDLFTKVTMDFTNAEWCEGGVFCLIGLGYNADVPDANGPNTNPFQFRMDTDRGTFAQGGQGNVVPEPSTYALMAAGLAALGVISRRRRAKVA